MTFITGQTNPRISNKDAILYLREIVAKQGLSALEAQKIPLDEAVWDIARYREFLALLRTALADCMNTFISTKAGTLTVLGTVPSAAP